MPGRLELLAENTKFQTTLLMVVFIIVVGVTGPYFTQDPGDSSGMRFEYPSWEHKMGTDSFGYDVWAKIASGTRNSLIVGFTAGLISLVIAFVIGGIGSYRGGLADEGLNLTSNVFLTLPMIPMLIVFTVLFEHRSLYLVAFIIAIFQWPGTARSIRSQVLSLKKRNFVDLAKVSGKGDANILFLEIFPNMLSYVFISFCGIVGSAIVMEAGISLLGLGPTTTTTLGSMLHWSIMTQAAQQGVWWWFVPPGVIVMVFTGSIITIGSVMDDVLNPRLRGVL